MHAVVLAVPGTDVNLMLTESREEPWLIGGYVRLVRRIRQQRKVGNWDHPATSLSHYPRIYISVTQYVWASIARQGVYNPSRGFCGVHCTIRGAGFSLDIPGDFAWSKAMIA